MPTYEFVARDESGRIIKGNLLADNVQAGKIKLRNLGYFVSSFVEKKVGGTTAQVKVKDEAMGNVKTKVKLASVISFCQQLADMLSAGIPIIECFNVLSTQIEDKNLRAVIANVRKDIESGSSLGDAISRYPNVFPQIAISLIKAGEVGGFLVSALQRIELTLEKQEDVRRKIGSAITYPIVVLLIAVVVVVFLLVFVIPIFSTVYGEMGGTLPLPTRILLTASILIRNNWYILIFIGMGLFAGFKVFKNSSVGHDFLDRIKLKLPIASILLKKSIVARFTRTLGALLSSGVPINLALDVTRKIVTNIVVLEIINKIIDNVNKGERIIVAMENTVLFPPNVVQMIRIGEEAGNLDIMMNRAADIMEREVDNTVKKLTTMIEPILTIVLGVIVASIAVAIYLPMFTMAKIMKD